VIEIREIRGVKPQAPLSSIGMEEEEGGTIRALFFCGRRSGEGGRAEEGRMKSRSRGGKEN
jgi:hypothetical protein